MKLRASGIRRGFATSTFADLWLRIYFGRAAAQLQLQRNQQLAAAQLHPAGHFWHGSVELRRQRPHLDRSLRANVNLLNGGAGTNVYDFENRRMQAGGVKLVYDGDGNRVSDTVAGVTAKYLVGGQNLTGSGKAYVQLRSCAHQPKANGFLSTATMATERTAVRD